MLEFSRFRQGEDSQVQFAVDSQKQQHVLEDEENDELAEQK